MWRKILIDLSPAIVGYQGWLSVIAWKAFY